MENNHSYTLDELNELSLTQMKEILKKKNLKVGGSKEELINRIISSSPSDDNTDDDEGTISTATVTVTPTPTKKRKITISDELLNKEEYFDEDIEGLNTDELKEILKRHKLPSSGLKDVLIERILNEIPTTEKSKLKISQELSDDLLTKKSFTKTDVKDLNVFNLKKILKHNNLTLTGLKEDLIKRIINNFPNDNDDDATDDMDVSMTIGTKKVEPKSSSKKEKFTWDDKYLTQEKFSLDELEKFSKDNLRSILSSRHLSTTGKREDVTNRIINCIPLPEYGDVENVIYEYDSENINTPYTADLASHGQSKCKRCDELIQQGRPRIYFRNTDKKLSYHAECFCRYKPNNITRFENIKWAADSSPQELAKVKELFNKFL